MSFRKVVRRSVPRPLEKSTFLLLPRCFSPVLPTSPPWVTTHSVEAERLLQINYEVFTFPPRKSQGTLVLAKGKVLCHCVTFQKSQDVIQFLLIFILLYVHN